METIAHQLHAISGELERLAVLVAANKGRDDGPREYRVAAASVRRLLAARRLRNQYIGKDLFTDPAWDMLLDLWAARLEGKQVSVSSLCIAAGVPATTALRWIGVLADRNLVERQPDANDKRRMYVELTDAAVTALERYFERTHLGAPNLEL